MGRVSAHGTMANSSCSSWCPVHPHLPAGPPWLQPVSAFHYKLHSCKASLAKREWACLRGLCLEA